MKKSNTAQPAARPLPSAQKKPVAQNAKLNSQTRKFLNQHYRAKYGVK